MEADASPGLPATPAETQPATRDRVPAVAGIVVFAALCAICVALVFRGGGYVAATWLPLAIATAALALVVTVSGPAAVSSRFQKVLLALFGAQAAWTLASLIWASSTANAWEEANRTLFYAMVIVLVFVAVRWAGRAGLTALTGMVAGTIGVVAVATIVILGTSADPLKFFRDGRLNYPVTYSNGIASLLVIGFWLVLGLASGVKAKRKSTRGGLVGGLPWWIQPPLLALGVLLVELALLPQSRGALWTLILVLPIFVILSPHRFRALIDLAIVALPVALFWNRFNGVYAAVGRNAPVPPALATALHAMGYSVLIVLAAWAMSWLVELRIGALSRRLTLWIGVALVVLTVAGVVAGVAYADQRTGGLGDYVQERWHEFLSDEDNTTGSASRFTSVGLDWRLTIWKVGAQAFEEHPVLGLGAQNFEIYFDQHRTSPLDIKQAHSLIMQLLSELGFPGLLLLLAFVALALVQAGRLRFRAHGRTTQAVIAAMMTAVISWFVHSSADWLWHLTAVTLPAMMLLGGLVGASKDQVLLDPPSAGAIAPPRRWARLARPVGVLLAVLVIISAGLPYLSLRYSSSAARATAASPQTALARADTATFLDPTSTTPFAVRAAVHAAAAADAPEASSARVEQAKLAAEDWVGATAVEPAGWLCYYNAAAAFLAARDAAQAAGIASAQEFDRQARVFLLRARVLNPLSPGIAALEKNL